MAARSRASRSLRDSRLKGPTVATGALVAGALVAFLIVGSLVAFNGFPLGGGDAEFTPALGVVVLGWALYYYFACESASGQTVGKRALNIRVVRTDGAPAGMREIGIRTVLRLVDGLFLYGVGLVGGIAEQSLERPAVAVDLVALRCTPCRPCPRSLERPWCRWQRSPCGPRPIDVTTVLASVS